MSDTNSSANAEDDAGLASEVDTGAATETAPQPQTRDRSEDAMDTRRMRKRISRLAEARDRAQSRLAEMERENAELKRQTLELGVNRLSAEERRAQAEMEQAQRELRRARQEHDDAAEEKAQQRLSDLQVDLSTIRVNKASASEQVDRAPQVQSQPQPTSAMRDWMDDNPWFRSDEAMTTVSVGFDREARRLGLAPESPEYFAHINKRIRSAFPEHKWDDDDAEPAAHADEEEDEPQPPRRVAQVAAAPRRNAAVTPQQNALKVPKLSADQVEAAKIAGVSPQVYAAQLAALRTRGDIR